MLLLSVAFAVALSGLAQAQQLLPPVFFIVAPGSDPANPQQIFVNSSTRYTVAVGSNVTFGCQYTDPAWRTTIGKWSVNPPGSVLFPLYENGYATDAMSDVVNRYPSLDLRVDGSGYFSSKPVIVYLQLINVAQYDIGMYGCFSNFGTSKVTPTANITIAVNSSALYGARMVSIDQQIAVTKPAGNIPSAATPYTCTIFRGRDTSYQMWFDKCQWSQLGKDVVGRTLSCQNTPSSLAWNAGQATQLSNGVGVITVGETNKPVTADMYPMVTGPAAGGAVFWQKNLVTDTFSLSLTADSIYAAAPNGWLNMTLGCYAYNNATNGLYQDTVTFAQPGVDLDLDPSLISCTRHHFVAPQNTVVRFACVVAQPLYRDGGALTWEISMPPRQSGPYDTVIVATQADINARKWGNVLQIDNVATTTAAVGGTSQVQLSSGLNVTVDTATTVNWRFRLISTYPSASISRSDYFSVSTTAGYGIGGSGPLPPPSGQVNKGGASMAMTSCLLIASVTGIAVLFPRA